MRSPSRSFSAASLTALANSQAVAPAYSSVYTINILGSVAGVPIDYGGLVFSASNSNIIYLGGDANAAAGRFYSVPVVRGAGGHVVSLGAGTALGFGTHNDGGIAFAPNGAILYAEYNTANVGEVVAGGNSDNRTVSLTALGVAGSPGALNFVPPGFAGAGQLKVASTTAAAVYNITYTPDGTGTFFLTAATLIVNLPGGPKGMPYVDSEISRRSASAASSSVRYPIWRVQRCSAARRIPCWM